MNLKILLPLALCAVSSQARAEFSVSPVVGYDPVPGWEVGAGVFYHDKQDPTLLKTSEYSSLFVYAPGTSRTSISVTAWTLGEHDRVAPTLYANTTNFREAYFGLGNNTRLDQEVDIHSKLTEVRPGLIFHPMPAFYVQTEVVFKNRAQADLTEVQNISHSQEGPLTGNWLGARLSLLHDTRDELLSPHVGGLRTLWLEPWIIQGSDRHALLRSGFEMAQFLTLIDPEWVLAGHLAGTFSHGDRSYVTREAIGGGTTLRGYLSNRFRGDESAYGNLELRFPLYQDLTGDLFTDVGRVWLDNAIENTGGWKISEGVGLRYLLPPSRKVKIRLDVGRSKEETTAFFAFEEIF